MDMLRGDAIAAAGLTQRRKLAQGLHARYLTDGFARPAGSSPLSARPATRSTTIPGS